MRAEIPPPDPRRRVQLPVRRATASRRWRCSTANPASSTWCVSDINMPRMDGLSLLAEAAGGGGASSRPIIVSAYGDMANIRTAMNRGAFDFLTKPIDFADLETTIAKTLRHRRAAARGAAAAGRPPSARMRRCRATSRPTSPSGWPANADAVEPGRRSGARSPRCSPTSPASPRWSRRSTRQLLGALLNDYLAGMTDIVFAHEGTVAKIVGDALHVLFGAPGEQPDHAARAVACALDLDAFAEAFRRALAAHKGIALGATRIGVHAGPAIVGNFGGSRFFDYTAYGDTINIAARLEAANKQLGTRICVSASAARAGAGFPRPAGRRPRAARQEPSRCALSSRCRPDGRTRRWNPISRPSRKLEAGDPGALGAFAAEVGMRPGRSPRELPPEAAAERRHRHAHLNGLKRVVRRPRPALDVRTPGIEPGCPKARDFKSLASASSATSARAPDKQLRPSCKAFAFGRRSPLPPARSGSRHDAVGPQARQMRGDRVAGDHQVRRDLGQWHQHEGALQHAWMRYLEPDFVNSPVAEPQNVEIDDARPPALGLRSRFSRRSASRHWPSSARADNPVRPRPPH